MVRLSVPTPVCMIPEPVNGCGCLFHVVYCDDRCVDYHGVIYSASRLFDSLVARLSSDSSISVVSVVLESGRLLCRCSRF